MRKHQPGVRRLSTLATTVAPPSLLKRALLALAAFRYRSAMRCAPSADRNKEPIRNLLNRYPPFSDPGARASCIEIASGTGQHVGFFARAYPHVVFQPTEYGGGSAGPEEPAYGQLEPVFASIIAHTGGLQNVKAPIELDAGAATWPADVEADAQKWDAVYACNICHISPYQVTEGLLAGAGRVLKPASGHLFIYGPFMVDGQHTAPSNEAFDQRLRGQNAQWGVRDATQLAQLATRFGLELVAREEMPANNFVLVLRKAQ